MSVLTGSVMWSMTVSAPEGFLVCDGSEVDENTHPALHAHLTNAGNPFGTVNDNPRLPDLITGNRFIRGAAPTAVGGSLPVGTTQNHQIQDHSHAFPNTLQPGGSGVSNQPGGGSGTHLSGYQTFFSGYSGGAGETRPINLGLLPCIAT